jgi:hypothetical protein
MTTTITRTECEVADQIIPWPDVKPGDLVLWDGELVPVEWNEPLPGHPDRQLVMLADGGPATISVGTHAAVRRYVETPAGQGS